VVSRVFINAADHTVISGRVEMAYLHWNSFRISGRVKHF
jgi:hypothetical protein